MKSPILLLIFNRPDTTRVVFDAIRKAKPPRLFVAADGPRANRVAEDEACLEARSVLDLVDWPCEVKTLFRDHNLGCRQAVSSAIDWFFENVEEGVIVEDDIVPNPDFFNYCDAALDRYREALEIMMVAGYNPLGANVVSSESFFSENPTIWGWATWRSRWKMYDVTMSDWSKKRFLAVTKNRLPWYVREYFIDAYEKTKSGVINTWDYQWTWQIQKNKALVLKPAANLITNIGVDGAHASGVDRNHYVAYGKLCSHEIRFPDQFFVAHQKDLEWAAFAFEGQKLRLFLRLMLRKVGLLAVLRAYFGKS